jgi:hypothetical protein
MAVRYAPLMLQGSARMCLNNLSPDNINAWLDFEMAFVRNFSTLYQRPGRPCQLSLCVQGKEESDRDYLMR